MTKHPQDARRKVCIFFCVSPAARRKKSPAKKTAEIPKNG